jgi:hypothetical protein
MLPPFLPAKAADAAVPAVVAFTFGHLRQLNFLPAGAAAPATAASTFGLLALVAAAAGFAAIAFFVSVWDAAAAAFAPSLTPFLSLLGDASSTKQHEISAAADAAKSF